MTIEQRYLNSAIGDLYDICEDLLDYYYHRNDGDDTDVDIDLTLNDDLPKDLQMVKNPEVRHCAKQIKAYVKRANPSVAHLPQRYDPTEALQRFNHLSASLNRQGLLSDKVFAAYE